MRNKRADTGLIGIAVGITLSIIQIRHPDWLGNHGWLLEASFILLGLALLLYLPQLAWFQRILGVVPLNDAPSDPPVALPSASATISGNTNTVSPTITVNVSQSNEKELEERIKTIASQYAGTTILVNGVGHGDPMIYLDIDPAKEGLRDHLICHNRGKSAAHNVQIEPITLGETALTFTPISVIGPGETGFSTPRAESSGSILHGRFLYWLSKDFESRSKNSGNITSEWKIPMHVRYSDALGKKQFTCVSELIFMPIRHQLNETLHKRERAWDFRAPQFKADIL